MGEYSELTSVMLRIFLAGGIVVAIAIVAITILVMKG